MSADTNVGRPRTAEATAPVDRALEPFQPPFAISTQAIRKTEHIELVRTNRAAGTQTLGFSPRPFVLCNFPHRKPADARVPYERYNGDFALRIVPDPRYGVPYGRDRIWPIYLSTLAVLAQSPVIQFRSASEILDLFGMPKCGDQFRRLVDGFKRIFAATILFGPRDDVRQRALAFDTSSTTRDLDAGVGFTQHRFHFVDQAQLWFNRDNLSRTIFRENIVTLNKGFFDEIMAHPIPTDLDAVRALASSPGALDLYMWLTYRCYLVRGDEAPAVPLFGAHGLLRQFGSDEYARPRDFHRQMVLWLRRVRALWPECPATLNKEKTHLIVRHAVANHRRPAPPALGA